MFRKLLMVAVIFFIAIAAKADDGQKIVSKVQKVTVFLSGAQVTRTAMVNINTGNNELIFGEISPGIDVQSIQVKSAGEFTILSVRHEIDFLNEQVKQKHVEELQATQKSIRDKIALQNSLVSIYQQEETMLIKNQEVNAPTVGYDVVKMKQALDFQTDRLTALKEKQQAVTNQIAALNIELQKYDKQIADITKGSTTATSNIIVTVSSKTTLQSLFTLSYVVHNAGWFPTYDIRAKDVNSPISISYKANVSQHCGEDWKNIKLTLSTGNPSVSGNKPELSPFYLNIFQPYTSDKDANRTLGEVVVTTSLGIKRQARQLGFSAVNTEAKSLSLEVNVAENQTNVEFNIENPYTVTNDGKICSVEINQVEVKAGYQYYVAPKLSTDVFLTGQITDWSKYKLLSGEANLFFEGTYIGKSQIDVRSLSDTLNLSLGVDKSILVKRTLEKDISERQTLGSNRKETKSWVIDIKNHKNQPVNLLVEDQVPVSQNSAIEVEVQETSGAKPDQNSGKVSWNLLLNSQDDKKVLLKYQVKYPKNQTVIVQ